MPGHAAAVLRRLRAAVVEVLGLFVSTWLSALLALAILAGGWALSRRAPGAAAGFAMAGALALLVVADALLAARRV
ncbi:MAG TPA: hypothetical protein VGQ42_01780 [Candidatus Dormibacteraeota bacterium]|jgi:hypothetical protein|nr:hypothetical protein [Candidatus Dormibacteraeota bacterium]